MSNLNLHEIARRVVPPDLYDDVVRSFEVPQFGPYHNEGPWMSAHLELVIGALRDAALMRFHEAVPQWAQPNLQDAAMRYLRWLETYALLHDVEKANCLSFYFADQNGENRRRVAVGWDDWLDIHAGRDGKISLEAAGGLDQFCRQRRIAQISYFQQDRDGRTRAHGKLAAERLRRRRSIPWIVVRAIADHEIAYQFHSRNPRTFRKYFKDLRPDQIWFCLLVNYADQVGSHGPDGQPNLDPVINLIETHESCL